MSRNMAYDMIAETTVNILAHSCEKRISRWNGNAFLMKFSSLPASKVVILTTFGAANDKNFVNKIFPFQCCIEDVLLCKSTLLRLRNDFVVDNTPWPAPVSILWIKMFDRIHWSGCFLSTCRVGQWYYSYSRSFRVATNFKSSSCIAV